MKVEDMRGMFLKHEKLRDEVKMAQASLYHHQVETCTRLVDGGHYDFLKVDWVKLERATRTRTRRNHD